MSFYLGVWKSARAISDDEAAAQYLALRDEESVESQFDDKVYAFYSLLTLRYPEVEMVPEEELDACPWACGLDFSGGHVIMAIRPEMSEKVVADVKVLAAHHELVCFDPQAGEVHLPARLRAQQEAAAIGFTGAASGHATQRRTRERAAEPVWFRIARSLASVIAAVAGTERVPGIAKWSRRAA
jgi:hypothetical protein